jgi:hypothetical protein
MLIFLASMSEYCITVRTEAHPLIIILDQIYVKYSKFLLHTTITKNPSVVAVLALLLWAVLF